MPVVFGLLALIAALFAPSAFAVKAHILPPSSFGISGSGPGQLSANRGVAIDQSDGSVYVADAGNYRVEKFDAAGNFVLTFGKGVNQTTSGDVCTAASGDTCGAGAQGSGGSGFDSNNGFSGPSFVAIDPTNGDVYVADSGTNVVDKFSSAGVFLSANDGSASGSAFSSLAGIAVDASRNLWVYDQSSQMRKFDSSGAFLTQWESPYGVSPNGIAVDSASNLYVVRGNPYVEKFSSAGTDLGEADTSAEAVSLAIDPATDDLYVGEESSQVKHYAGDCSIPCSPVESFGSEDIGKAAGIAVRDANADVYVSDPDKSAIEVFSPKIVPGVSAEPATGVTGVLATLNGSVNPDSIAVSECKFEYGPTSEYGSSKPCEGAIATDGNDHPVTAALAALNPATTYHWRIVAINANGTSKSSDQTFTTSQPSITGEASEVKGARATLNGIVLPEGEEVEECFFEYGAGLGYGLTAPCEGAIPTDEGEHPVTAALTHLTPNFVYHFRLVIDRGNGDIRGVDRSFQTQATVLTGATSTLAPPSASVEGTINPEGILYTSCAFEYGLTTTYGSSAPCSESPATIGTGESPVAVHANLAGLAFGATYHYRLVATNADGSSAGEDKSFQTPGAVIQSTRAISVGLDEATLETKINPTASPASYHLEYGTTSSYGQSTPEVFVGEDEESHTLSDVLTDLSQGTTYHWRVVATNAIGASVNPDHSFTTYVPASAPQTNCPNQVFRTGPSAVLPDCRAYEQATPTEKHGANIKWKLGTIQASSAGDRLTFGDSAGLPTSGGSSTVFVAARGAGAWSSNGVAPPVEAALSSELLGWDAEIATSVSNTRNGIYANDIAAGTYQLAVPTENIFPSLAGFAADTSHLIFESSSALVPGSVTGKINLYDLDHGTITLAGRIPVAPTTFCDDASGPACVPAPQGSFAGPYNWEGSTTGEYSGASGSYYTQDAISNDGSRVFFTAAGSGQLYVREGGTKTTQISASQASTPDPNGSKPAAFMAATPDGSKAFFTSCERLTDDSTAVSNGAETCTGEEQGQDLYSYAYDTTSGDLTDLTVDSNASDRQRAGVVGVLGTSGDGSYVYFAANGVLASGGSPGDCVIAYFGGRGACNLYLYHAGAVTFIAPIGSSGPDHENLIGRFEAPLYPTKSSRVAADGTLLFGSTESLTGYDSTPGTPPKGDCGEGRCTEPSATALPATS